VEPLRRKKKKKKVGHRPDAAVGQKKGRGRGHECGCQSVEQKTLDWKTSERGVKGALGKASKRGGSRQHHQLWHKLLETSATRKAKTTA